MDEEDVQSPPKHESKPLIPAWDSLKSEVARIVSRSSLLEPRSSTFLPSINGRSQDSFASSDSLAGGGSNDSIDESTRSGYPITIPYGFQKISNHYHPNSNLDSVIYIPFNRKNRIATKDNHHVSLYEDGRLLGRYDTLKSKGDITGSSLMGINHWVCMQKWSAVIIANSKLELKILNSELRESATIIFGTPVLHLNAVPQYDEIIICTVGRIVSWEITTNSHRGPQSFSFVKPRLEIKDFDSDQWISFTVVAEQSGYLFAVYDNTVRIFHLNTGESIETLPRLHEATISALVYNDELGMLVTGSRDSSIKIWSRTRNLLFELSGHTDEVSSLLFNPMKVAAQEDSQNLPFLLSASKDGSIRQWNIDTGTCVYVLDTGETSLGIKRISEGYLLNFSPQNVNIWDVNNFFKTYLLCRQSAVNICRYAGTRIPNRILVTTLDGSVRLLGSRNSHLLSLAYPTLSKSTVERSIYHGLSDALFTFLKDGSIIRYDTKTNPAIIKGEFPPPNGAETLTCQDALYYEGNVHERRIQFLTFLAGSNAGQLICINAAHVNQRQCLVQAHTSSVHFVRISKDGRLLFTSDKHNIKIWTIQFRPTRKKSQAADTELSIPLVPYVECVMSTESHSNLSAIASVNEEHETIAIADTAGRISFFYYGNTTISLIKRKGNGHESHTQPITCIDANEPLNIFASASYDGSVKVWRNARLIREMQFGGAVQSCAFLNNRGDLLVGLHDQVALVHFQDYLPPFILEEMLMQDLWLDDIDESPNSFDENIDVWGVQQQETIVPVVLDKIETISRTQSDHSVIEPVDDSDEVHGTLEITLSVEHLESNVSSKKKYVGLISVAASVPTNYRPSYARTPSPEEGVTVMDEYKVSNLPAVGQDELPRLKVKPHSQLIDMTRRSVSMEKFREIMSHVNEQSLIEAAQPPARKSTILRGLPLPNSVVTGQLKDELEQASNRISVLQQRRTIIMLEQKKLREKYRSLASHTEADEIDEPQMSELETTSFEPQEEEDQPTPKKGKTKSKKKLVKVKSKAKSDRIHEVHELESDQSSHTIQTQAEVEIIPEKPVPLPPSHEVTEETLIPIQSFEKEEDVVQPYEAINISDERNEANEKVIEVADEIFAIPAALENEEVKRQLLPSREKEILLLKFRAQQAEKSQHAPEKVVANKSTTLDTRFTRGIPKNDIFIKQSTLRQVRQEPKGKDPFSGGQKKSIISRKETEALHIRRELSRIKSERLEKFIDIDPELEVYDTKKPWALFSHSPTNIDPTSPKDVLKGIIEKPWFPGIPKRKKITLASVIDVLCRINEEWDIRAKIEASVCLGNIYQNFGKDLHDYLDKMIEAQVTLMSDSNSQVRAVATTVLTTFKRSNDTVKTALISKLADYSEAVRNSARAGLLKIGISSKEDLKNAMVSLQMMKEETALPKSTYLDFLYKEIIATKQRRALSKNHDIEKWLQKIHPDSYGKEFTRTPSALETLVFPAEERSRAVNQLKKKAAI